MTITSTIERKKIWDFLIDLGCSEYGAAGMMGNMYAESEIDSSAASVSLYQRYIKDGDASYKQPIYADNNRKFNNKLYTERVDSGYYSKSEFFKLHNKCYGYGIIQYKTKKEKEVLWNYTIEQGKSISDLDGQLQALKHILENTKCFSMLKLAKSIVGASDGVLLYLIPTNNTVDQRKKRQKYSAQIFDLYHSDTYSFPMPKNLKLGITNDEDVVFLQILLNGSGYLGSTGRIKKDGNFGKKTEYAVKVFQKKNGLRATGIVNSKMWKKLMVINYE